MNAIKTPTLIAIMAIRGGIMQFHGCLNRQIAAAIPGRGVQRAENLIWTDLKAPPRTKYFLQFSGCYVP